MRFKYKNLIDDFIYKNKDDKYLLQSLNGNMQEFKILLDEIFNVCIDNKLDGSLYAIITIISKYNLFNENYIERLNKLLIETWHHNHDEIMYILFYYPSPTSIDYLYKAINLNLYKIRYTTTFEEKCIYLLGYLAIKNKEALEKLKLLSKDEYFIISEDSIEAILSVAYKNHLVEELEMVINFIIDNKVFEREEELTEIDGGGILDRLLLESWHKKHNEIVTLIKTYGCISSVDYLYKAIGLKFDYLDDNFYINCIEAIGDIYLSSANSEFIKSDLDKALEKLKILTKNDNIIICKTAKAQLYKINNNLK